METEEEVPSQESSDPRDWELLDAIQCPVCRASQEPNSQQNLACRRCGADLNLYLHCLRSRRWAEHQLQKALDGNDLTTAERMKTYLTWLVG